MPIPQARLQTSRPQSSGRRRQRGAAASAQRQALVAAGVVAIAAAGPAAVGVAAEPDSEHEGSGPAAAGAPADPAASPNYDPGGNPTPLPETPPASDAEPPSTASADAWAPDDLPAVGDVDDPVVDPGDDAPAVSDRTAPAQNVAASPVTATPTTPSAPPQNATAAPTPAAPGVLPTGAVAPSMLLPAPRAVDRSRRVLTVRSRPVQRSPLPVGSVASVPRGTVARSTSVSTRATAVVAAPRRVAGGRTRAGDRIHIVLAGESLWAIATDLLGRDASPAEVAREVERLWRLNRARIGTGDPDLLFPGTTLVLRYRSSTAR